MLPRQLRVGDLVDDYCPRERRLSDHAIVAMVGDDVRQVRCTACDTEHEYRGGKARVSRKKKPVLPPPSMTAPAPLLPAVDEAQDAEPDAARGTPAATPTEPAAAQAAAEQAAEPEEPGDAQPGQDGPFHRRLIRATLPRIEGDVPARPIPEFTMHKANAPGGNRRPFRQGGGGGQGGQGGRPGGMRYGQGQGQGFGNRSGRGGQGPGAHGGPGGPRHGMGQRSSRGPKKH